MKNSKNLLLIEARSCQKCVDILPFAPNPILQHGIHSSICLIGQAPGLIAHRTSIPWNDRSGDRLRDWLGITKEQFYDEKVMTILPMSFCYPGRGKAGDNPPVKVCAPLWHKKLLGVTKPKLTLLVGKHAQDYYLTDTLSLTQRLKNWQAYLPQHLVLPHPSPRNNIWLKKNPWFESEIVPQIKTLLSDQSLFL